MASVTVCSGEWYCELQLTEFTYLACQVTAFRSMLAELMPKRIVLVRHGASEGNADESLYREVPHHMTPGHVPTCYKALAEALGAAERQL